MVTAYVWDRYAELTLKRRRGDDGLRDYTMGGFNNLISGVAGGSGGQVSKASTPGDRPYLDEELPLWARKAMTRGLQDRVPDRGQVLKQDVDRRASLPQSLQNALDEVDAAPKPYDAELLRDLSSSTVPQTYVDTLAQDAASANWRLVPTDEDADVDPADVAQIERALRDLVPDSTFPEFLEEWSRNILRLGDGTVVKHYPGGEPENGLLERSGDGYEAVGEIVHIDSATMFKRLDDDGFPEGYVQMTASGGTGGKTNFDGTPLGGDEVVWVSWARRGNHVYGEGPVEKGQQTIEILEEINEKELLDLVQGMPPGIVSRPPESEVPIDSADWENFKDDMRLNEGERHRLGFTKFPVDYTALTPNYQELQLLDRYTSKVTELGGVFKVNPSYAGFDFENVNRATDESQREAYKQRGFQVLISRLEAALTFGVVPYLDVDIGTDLRFQFEREQSITEKQEKASYLSTAVEAGKQAANAGLDVQWKDGIPIIEDGEMDEGNAGGGGGGGMDGLFGSAAVEAAKADALEKGAVVLGFPMGGVAHSGDVEEWARFFNSLLDRGADRVVDLAAERNGASREYPTDGLPRDEDPLVAVHGLPKDVVTSVLRSHDEIHLQIMNTGKSEGGSKNPKWGSDSRASLSKEEVDTLDEILFSAFEEQIYPESADDVVVKRVFSSSDIPDYVREKIEEALDSGSVFEGFDSISDEFARVQDMVEDILRDNLLDEDGWKLSDIRDDLQGTFDNLSAEEAETIARTETASTLNTAREKGYEERDDAATLRFEWTGPSDSRTTIACEFLKEGSAAVEDAAFSFEGTRNRALPMDELKRVERRVASYYFPDLSYREHTLHPNERHTFKRVLDAAPAESSPAEAGA